MDRYSNLFLFQHICPLPTLEFSVKDVCAMEFNGGLQLYKRTVTRGKVGQ